MTDVFDVMLSILMVVITILAIIMMFYVMYILMRLWFGESIVNLWKFLVKQSKISVRVGF